MIFVARVDILNNFKPQLKLAEEQKHSYPTTGPHAADPGHILKGQRFIIGDDTPAPGWPKPLIEILKALADPAAPLATRAAIPVNKDTEGLVKALDNEVAGRVAGLKKPKTAIPDEYLPAISAAIAKGISEALPAAVAQVVAALNAPKAKA